MCCDKSKGQDAGHRGEQRWWVVRKGPPEGVTSDLRTKERKRTQRRAQKEV